MTDDHDDRAERAFRDALRREADQYDVVPLDPVTSRPRRWWPAALAAAAVLVLVGTLALVLPGSDDDPVATTGTPSASGDLRGPGEPPEGWHWESSLDAVVAVPDSWGYGFAADSQWCVGDGAGLPDKPFVDLHTRLMASTLVDCGQQDDPANFTNLPENLLRTHLSFPWADADHAEGTRTWRGWTQVTRRVGSAVIQVLTDEKHLEIAQQVIDSAQQVEVDANGCVARSPIQKGGFTRPPAPFDVTDLEQVDALAICQYRLASPDQLESGALPGLIASRLLEGQAARQLVTAIQRSPEGGGPNQPDSCLHEMWGDVASVVRITSDEETYEMYAYYDWCIGNGLDDGTTLRTLTADTCAPLFGDRLFWGGGGGRLVDLCLDDRD